MKFSVIVPVYNVEIYLNKCLSSLANQSYKNFEVIIILDKCDDKCEEIVDTYVKKYNWIKGYEEHTGLAKARNIGIQMALGDYIVLLDSDDFLNNDFLETINNALVDKPDVLRFQVRDVFDDRIVNYEEKEFETMSGIEAFKQIVNYHYIENAWAYCYKRIFLLENKFKYMENCIAEDYGLTPIIIACAKSVKSISYIGYNYVQRNNSLMNNNNYIDKIKKMEDMIKQSDYEKKYLRKIKDSEIIIRFLNNSLIYFSTTLNYKDYRKYNKLLKEKKCFNYIPSNGIKSKIKKILIYMNSFIFYNYLMR